MALSLADFAGRGSRGPRCSFGRLLTGLPDDDRRIVEAAMSDPDVSSSRIAEVLKANGHTVGDYTVARHRRGKCQC